MDGQGTPQLVPARDTSKEERREVDSWVQRSLVGNAQYVRSDVEFALRGTEGLPNEVLTPHQRAARAALAELNRMGR
jgi:hypothetical protein